MSQIFRPGANTIARVVFTGTLLSVPLAFLLGFALVRSPYATGVGIAPLQPVPFSHQHHVGELGLDCRYCHTSVEISAVASLPPTETCMTCHSQLWTNAAMLAPVRESLAQNQPLAWQRVYDLPDFVYFNHSIHIAQGIGCRECHGRIDTMPLTRKVQAQPMHWCLDCHRDPAQNIRPRDEVFNMAWQHPANQREMGRRLVQAYDVQTAQLTDCSICHR